MEKYVSTIINYKLLHYELKIFLKIEKETGLSGRHLINYIKGDNLLQLNKQNNILYNEILKRMNLLSPKGKELGLGFYQDRKILDFHLILQNNKLFYDFFNEEILKELNDDGHGYYEKHKIKVYFDRLVEQGLINWKVSTINSVEQMILNTLINVGILNKKNNKVSKPYIYKELRVAINESCKSGVFWT